MTGLIGISYKSADLEIRERFAFSKNEITAFTEYLLQNRTISGVVILSTCNRTEIYYNTTQKESTKAPQVIMEALALQKNYHNELRPYFYFKEGKQMVEHLFKVVSGIDSLIVGEDQIIGQVKDAFQFAKEIKSTDKILRFPDMSNQNVLMIGAGQTGQLVLNSLRKSTFKSLHIANRTYAKAEELSHLYGGKSIHLEKVNHYLNDSDIIFVATDSPEPLIKLEALKDALQRRNRSQKILLFDLSVPRNVEISIGKLEAVELYTIDDLTKIVKSTNQKRLHEISAAMEIIHHAEDVFMTWKHEQELVPTILKIKKNFHQLNQQEMEEFKKIRSIKEDKLLNEYSHHITEKFARVFIKNLKEISKEADKKDFITMAEEFFEL